VGVVAEDLENPARPPSAAGLRPERGEVIVCIAETVAYHANWANSHIYFHKA
jgi:hypothetical protein